METIHRNIVAVPSGKISVEGNSQEAVKAVSDAITAVSKLPYFSGLMLARSIQSQKGEVTARYFKPRAVKAKK